VVLQAVASAVQRTCRDADTVARYGGEEISVVLPETDHDVALEVAERIRQAVEAMAVSHESEQLAVTVSLGVATLDRRQTNEQALVRAADTALYAAKQAGRNRVRGAVIER
jgi:diguanylate cyclase (GGDEF)-like protein